jgi:hypothetical protein
VETAGYQYKYSRSLQHNSDLVFLRDFFKQNGCNDRQSHRALNRLPHLAQPDSEPNSVAFLPFVRTIFDHNSRVPALHNIKSVGLPHMTLSSIICHVVDSLGLRKPGVYRVPYEWCRSTLGR